MSRISVSLLVLAASMSTQGMFAQGLSQGDRDYTISALHASRKLFLDTLAPLSEAQLKWKPSPDAWSIGEIAEHLALIEDGIPEYVKKAVASPATPEKKKPNPSEMDRQIVKNVPVRDQKFKAPEKYVPMGHFKDKAAAIAAFRTSRDRNIAYVRETKDDLRVHFAPHPAFGDLDGLQWYVLLAAHAERHVNQMKEVMGAAGFPAK